MAWVDQLAAVYDRDRAVPLDALEPWRAALAAYLPPASGLPVLDLGAGTGLFAAAIARWFGAPAVHLLASCPSDPGPCSHRQGHHRHVHRRGLHPPPAGADLRPVGRQPHRGLRSRPRSGRQPAPAATGRRLLQRSGGPGTGRGCRDDTHPGHPAPRPGGAPSTALTTMRASCSRHRSASSARSIRPTPRPHSAGCTSIRPVARK
jgi:hypothetical protein